MLKEALKDILSAEESNELISAFDQIGDIIIVRIPDSLLSKKKKIGEVLLNEVKVAKSVFYQASDVKGDYRTRKLEILAGEDKTETQYREHGCRFLVDVEKAFFSPRLSTERQRIAELTKNNETVVNMFAGVGMFSIMIAKSKKAKVYSIDVNPIASELCEKNIQINKLAGEVISINGDAAEIIEEKLQDKSDRTLMLLPERSDEFLESAISATKNNGIIHYYSHIHADKKSQAGKQSEEHFLSITPVQSEILGSKIVRAVGPRYYQTVVDVRISK
ncbi:MAG: class I SAM-dependent methyltransferase family protein [Nitrosopumilaceae archaeon]|nr:class I SAM-dependent methyltransferase family protein [Nitrosopumilaceae archaeon]